MRTFVLGLVLSVFVAVCLSATAQAEPRTITLDFGAEMPVRLPPPEQPAVKKAAPPPAPVIAPAPKKPDPIVTPAEPPPAPILVPNPPVPPARYQPAAVKEPSGFLPCDYCSDGSCVYLGAEYLYWWVRSQPVPPLVTTSPPGTPRELSGVLGQPTTAVLVGSGGVNGDGQSGLRLTGGFWIDECHTFGVQASYFFLGSQDAVRPVSSDASGLVSRPFTDVLTGRQASELVGFPGAVSGVATVTARNDGLRGASVMLRENCYGVGDRNCCSWMRLDVLVGYAFLGLEEGLSVREDLVPTTPGVTPGTTVVVQDTFRTRNEFHGAQLGASAQRRMGAFWYQIDGLLALGGTSQTAFIEGSTTNTTPNGMTSVAPGGLLAQTTNAGLHRRDRFSLVPQLGLKLGYAINEQVQLTLGYNFLYWTGVARPGDQVDLGVNPNRIPPAMAGGPARPAFTFKDGDLWAQGLTLGVEFSY
jgi:hypothetical protein